jgi:ankyrin repeat protein
LHGAANRGRSALMQALVARKADPEIRDARGRTAAEIVPSGAAR